MTIDHGCKCSAEWSGLRVEHCTGCHETFTGTEAGDRHRVVERVDGAGSEIRRCLTVEEIRTLARKDGEPWFVEEVNQFGTRLWSRNRPGRVENPAWTPGGRDEEARTAVAA